MMNRNLYKHLLETFNNKDQSNWDRADLETQFSPGEVEQAINHGHLVISKTGKIHLAQFVEGTVANYLFREEEIPYDAVVVMNMLQREGRLDTTLRMLQDFR